MAAILILIIFRRTLEKKNNSVLAYSITPIIPELFRFLKYANEYPIKTSTHKN